jgi:hypothetical protein
MAIILYIVSAFFYSYEVWEQGWLPGISNPYPYRDYAIPLAMVASALLVVGAILYSKRK